MPRVVGQSAHDPRMVDVELDDGTVQPFTQDVVAAAGLASPIVSPTDVVTPSDATGAPGRLPPVAPITGPSDFAGAPMANAGPVRLVDVSPAAATDAEAFERAQGPTTLADVPSARLPAEAVGQPLEPVDDFLGIKKNLAEAQEIRDQEDAERQGNLAGADFSPVPAGAADLLSGIDVSAGFKEEPAAGSNKFGTVATSTQKLQREGFAAPTSPEQAEALAEAAGNLAGASDDERKAIVAEHQALADAKLEQSLALEEQLKHFEEQAQKQQAKADAVRKDRQRKEAALSAFEQKYRAEPDIDPARVFGEKGTPGRVFAALGAAIAAGLGQAAATLTGGQNAALGIINAAIDRDIQAQQLDRAKAKGDVDSARRELSDFDAAAGSAEEWEAMSRASMLKALAIDAEQMGLESQSDQARASAERVAAELNRQAAESAMAAQQAALGRISTEEQITSVQPVGRAGGGGGGGGGRARGDEGGVPSEREQARQIIEFMEHNPDDQKSKVTRAQVESIDKELRDAGVVARGKTLKDLRSLVQSRLDKEELPASVGPWTNRLFSAMSAAGFGSFTPDEWQEYRQLAGQLTATAVKALAGPGAVTDNERAHFSQFVGLAPEDATPTSVALALARMSRENAHTEASIVGSKSRAAQLVYRFGVQRALSEIRGRDAGGERVGRAGR